VKTKEPISRPFRIIYGLMGVLFVIMLGGAIVISNLGNTVENLKDNVENTDAIVSSFVSPEGRESQQASQQQAVAAIVSGMNCNDQINLQRMVDELAKNGLTQLEGVVVIVPECQPKVE